MFMEREYVRERGRERERGAERWQVKGKTDLIYYCPLT